MRQSPPVLITHAKDERGRNLLHLACRYGQLSLVLPLCRYLDVNSQDVEGRTPLHLAYYHGYDRIVKVLLFHPLIDADRRDRFGHRALEQERSTGVRALVALRELSERVSDLFLSNAALLSLLLLYFVSTANLDGIHAVYLLFFVTFFTFPPLAQRYWAVLVVYCAFILVLLFSYSVVFPVVVVGDWVDWLVLIGVFETKELFKDLALYYTVFVVVLVQWYVFETKERRKREKREQREKEREKRELASGHLSRVSSFPAPHSSASSSSPSFAAFGWASSPASSSPSLDSRKSAYLPVYRASAIGLATLTLVVVGLSTQSSLFYLGYLTLFTLSLLALALGGRHYNRLLLAFYIASTLYSLVLVVLEYLYLTHALRPLSPWYRSWAPHDLTPAVVGFRARDGVNITWTMFPSHGGLRHAGHTGPRSADGAPPRPRPALSRPRGRPRARCLRDSAAVGLYSSARPVLLPRLPSLSCWHHS